MDINGLTRTLHLTVMGTPFGSGIGDRWEVEFDLEVGLTVIPVRGIQLEYGQGQFLRGGVMSDPIMHADGSMTLRLKSEERDVDQVLAGLTLPGTTNIRRTR